MAVGDSPIVREWTPSQQQQDYWQSEESQRNLLRQIQRQAQDTGVVKPKGYVVSFHYNPEVEVHHFGRQHPMKPWRLRLTKRLILSYGLQYAMDNYLSRPAMQEEMAAFHDEEYLEFLRKVTPDNMHSLEEEQSHYNFGSDCPVFDGLWGYCRMYAGASLDAAHKLVNNQSDIAINWSGGLHHAHKKQASGFCYINDIVLAILELLRVHPRVLYIDIDVHHGDGVERAFASTDRVVTLSFHKYDTKMVTDQREMAFFPGTGDVNETGPKHPDNPGAHHSLNVPLDDGINDDMYTSTFEKVTTAVIASFQPTAIVMQCGADSLGVDRLGRFNLNIKAHGACLEFIKRQKIPLLVLGGGGYTARNVARLWCHETSVCTSTPLSNEIPSFVPYRQAFEGPENGEGKLYPSLTDPKRFANANRKKKLEETYRLITEQLRYLNGAPSVQMQRVPDSWMDIRREIDREIDEEELEDDDGEGRREKEEGIGERMEF